MGGGGDGEGGGRDNNSGKIVSGGAGGARLGKDPFGCGANGGGLGEENDEVSPNSISSLVCNETGRESGRNV